MSRNQNVIVKKRFATIYCVAWRAGILETSFNMEFLECCVELEFMSPTPTTKYAMLMIMMIFVTVYFYFILKKSFVFGLDL